MRKYQPSVILVNPPVSEDPWPPFLKIMTDGLDPDQYSAWPLEHLGLMSIKAAAEEQGIDIVVIDGIVEQHASADDTWKEIKRIANELGPPSLIGFSSMIAFMQNVDLAERAKEEWPDVVTILGQDFAVLNWQRILETYHVIDLVGVGDGEIVIPAIVKNIRANKGYNGIPGTAWRDTKTRKIHRLEANPVELDALPWPDRTSYRKLKPLGFTPAVFSSRGCPYRCKFCTTGAISSQMKKGGYRHKSIKNLIDEIEHLHRIEGIDFITIVDDLFLAPGAGSKKRATEFANELLRRNMNIGFMFDTRVDAIEEELFKLLYKAGLRRVVIGVETGSETQLGLLGKEYSKTKSVENNLKILTDIGIEVVPGIIAFHPFVTPSELRQSLNLLDVINYKNMSVLLNRVVTYPGTPLYKEYKEKGLITNDWPVGEWEFEDPLAESFYQKIAKGIKGVEYQDARQFVDDCLIEWEKNSNQIQTLELER